METVTSKWLSHTRTRKGWSNGRRNCDLIVNIFHVCLMPDLVSIGGSRKLFPGEPFFQASPISRAFFHPRSSPCILPTLSQIQTWHPSRRIEELRKFFSSVVQWVDSSCGAVGTSLIVLPSLSAASPPPANWPLHKCVCISAAVQCVVTFNGYGRAVSDRSRPQNRRGRADPAEPSARPTSPGFFAKTLPPRRLEDETLKELSCAFVTFDYQLSNYNIKFIELDLDRNDVEHNTETIELGNNRRYCANTSYQIQFLTPTSWKSFPRRSPASAQLPSKVLGIQFVL